MGVAILPSTDISMPVGNYKGTFAMRFANPPSTVIRCSIRQNQLTLAIRNPKQHFTGIDSFPVLFSNDRSKESPRDTGNEESAHKIR